MAPLHEMLEISSNYMDENHNVNKCSNCAKMRNYLKVVTTELKSAQSIIKILVEELETVSFIPASAHHINSVSTDSLWTEIQKKNRVTNLQAQSSLLLSTVRSTLISLMDVIF
jgi:hypothetical protein